MTTTNSESTNVSYKPAINELAGIISGWRIWCILAWDDIRLRYRRSSLGPFWITISMAVKIYFMGFLYGHLFKVDIAQYFPFLATGIITWTTASTIIIESSHVFVESESYLRNMKVSYAHLIMRVIMRNVIIFAHNVLAYIPIILYFGHSLINFQLTNVLVFIPNLFIIILDCILIGSILAILSTRFRDMPIIIDSLLQVIFFMTPIMWLPSLLPVRLSWLAVYNPMYHIINSVRAPLLGQPVALESYFCLAIVSIVSFVSFYYLMNRCKYRIIFWL